MPFVSISLHFNICLNPSLVVTEIVLFWVRIIAVIRIGVLPRLLALAIEPQVVLLLPKAIIYYILLVRPLLYPRLALLWLGDNGRCDVFGVQESFANFLLLVLYEIVVVAVGSQAFVTHVFYKYNKSL